eukprot:Em0008g1056a
MHESKDGAEEDDAAIATGWRKRSLPLSRLRLLMLVSLAFAIDFCYSVEVGYGIPALLKTGVDEKYATVIWGVGPLLGVLFQGYLGSASDRCTSSWGRRRPFIAVIAAGLSLSLLVFPYGKPIATALGLKGHATATFVVFFTFGALVALDFCLDQLQSAVRMYLLDSVPAKDGERGNFMYSAAMGLGACFGSALSAVSWEDVGVLVSLPGGGDVQLQVVFAGAFAVVLVCSAASLVSVPESSPAGHGGEANPSPLARGNPEASQPAAPCPDRREEGEGGAAITCFSCLAEVYHSVSGTVQFARHLSPAMLHLWGSLFLQWTSILTLYIFFTDYVGEVVYGGVPTSTNRTLLALYDQGVRAGCWYQTLLNLSGFLYSLFCDTLIRQVGLRRLMAAGHFLLFLSVGLGMVSSSSLNLLVMSVVCGIVFSNLLAIPYALIPYYEETGILLQSSTSSGDDVRGKAVAFVYTSMFLSQFFTASATGPIIKAYGSASAIMVISFLFSLLALPTIFLLVMRDTPTSLRSPSLGLRTVVRTVVGAVFRVITR